MAMKEIKKQSETPKEELTAEVIDEKVLKAVDEVAENDEPFLKQEVNGELTVMGDPNKTSTPDNNEVYTVGFLFDKAHFDVKDFDNVTYENEDYFTTSTTATQEKITPYNRTYFSSVSMQFLSLFFIEKNGSIELKDEKDMEHASYIFYRTPQLVENLKYFTGNMLGIDEELIPYQNDIQLLENAIDLISKNPTLINEAYYQVK